MSKVMPGEEKPACLAQGAELAEDVILHPHLDP